ncbi:MAG: hypothetical protein ACI9XC_002237 [Gammaproteobacteria bacterium]|jgi:hypothetical protein
MSKIILLILILAGITFWWHWKSTIDPKERKQLLQKTIIGSLVIVSLLAVVTGRMHWLGALFAGMLAMLRQYLPLVIRYFPMITQLYRNFTPRSQAQDKSTVITKYIEMMLDHESGKLSGKVIAGEFKNKLLDDLDLTQLSKLFDFCVSHDMDSARLLENYLVDRFGENPSNSTNSNNSNIASSTDEMSQSEALQILGLEDNPDSDEINKSYRKIMQQLHPDRGGNQYFAVKANQARQVLLNKYG